MKNLARLRRRHGAVSQHDQRTAAQVLPYLNPDLRAALAGLHGAPISVAEATVQLLPFGSRAALETVDPALAVPGRVVDDEGHRCLNLTPFAYEVMAEAAAQADADPQAVSEWTTRAQRAVQAITEHR
jgi:hypothetical protein